MLVYGDHAFKGQLQALRTQLYALTQSALEHPHELDSLRKLLILCGQVEQGVHDSLLPAVQTHRDHAVIRQFHLATAHAAAAFYTLAYRQAIELPRPMVDTQAALLHLSCTLDDLRSARDLAVTIKLPEGFNLYALYPEQYMVAAAQWLAEHNAHRLQGAVVVGIRTIGTTLAAVVSTVLRAGGWQVQSFTVRPTGEPFRRTLTLDKSELLDEEVLNPECFALVVDEGPGISGSSMAATASALVATGFAKHNIAFLPGHAHDPGGAGSEDVQRWWQTTTRYVADAKSLLFRGLPLQDALASTLPEEVLEFDDLSGGQWRRFVYSQPSQWPPVCTAFERIKYRYTLQSGRKVLFKFLGLGAMTADLMSTAEAAANLLNERARHQPTTPALHTAYGFTAMEWIEGSPLSLEHSSPAMLQTLGKHIAQVATSPMAQEEVDGAIVRLSEMLYVNVREAFGEDAAELTRQFHADTNCPQSTFGDGRMQPYKLIRGQDNQIYKVDSTGHDNDHTLIGKAPAAWDLAGAIVEWRLDHDATEDLLRAFNAASGQTMVAKRMAFYCAAYLAFRIGKCVMAAQVHDPCERSRLQSASVTYKKQLADLLGIQAFPDDEF